MYLVEYRNNNEDGTFSRTIRKDMTAEDFFLWTDSLAYGAELLKLWWYTQNRMEQVEFLDKGCHWRDPDRMEIRDSFGNLLDVGYGQ